MVSAEQKEYAEVFDYSKITEKKRVSSQTSLDEQSLDLIFCEKTNPNSSISKPRKTKERWNRWYAGGRTSTLP